MSAGLGIIAAGGCMGQRKEKKRSGGWMDGWGKWWSAGPFAFDFCE